MSKSLTSTTTTSVSAFLKKHKTISAVVKQQQRLLFAIDATASRQPTWDLACDLTGALFSGAEALPGLTLKLCFYRGFGEFRQSDWLSDPKVLSRKMATVRCEAGQTQIERTLQFGLQEHKQSPIKGVVFIGDAIEEPPHRLLNLAGQCAMVKLPLFIFQEGHDGTVQDVFTQMARLSKGAYARFDLAAPDRLRDLLNAVATYARGGYTALKQQNSTAAQLLLNQLPD